MAYKLKVYEGKLWGGWLGSVLQKFSHNSLLLFLENFRWLRGVVECGRIFSRKWFIWRYSNVFLAHVCKIKFSPSSGERCTSLQNSVSSCNPMKSDESFRGFWRKIARKLTSTCTSSPENALCYLLPPQLGRKSWRQREFMYITLIHRVFRREEKKGSIQSPT